MSSTHRAEPDAERVEERAAIRREPEADLDDRLRAEHRLEKCERRFPARLHDEGAVAQRDLHDVRTRPFGVAREGRLRLGVEADDALLFDESEGVFELGGRAQHRDPVERQAVEGWQGGDLLPGRPLEEGRLRHADAGSGKNRHCPSDTTSASPSTTRITVWSSIA